jgi:Phytanoyl-CoA dioxygenase (PhyH)
MAVPWVESPFFDQLLESSELDPQQRELAQGYSRRGYAVIDTAIPEPTLEAVSEGLEGRFVDWMGTGDSRIANADLPAVREIATWPRVLELLRVLYRREPIPFQTINFEVGTQQAVHNDAIHFHCIPQRFMCGVWVALEDTDAENGPLFYYPGSHALPIREMPDLGLPASPDSYDRYVEALEAMLKVEGLEPEELHVRRGQAIIWAANLSHGGSRVLDPERTRLSQVTHYLFADSLYYTPQGTDLVEGRLQLLDIRDLRSGQMVPHVYRGGVIYRPTEPGATVLELGGPPGPAGRLWRRLRPRLGRLSRRLGLRRGRSRR